jgi:hypothetical protein
MSTQIRQVVGKAPDMVYTVVEQRLADGRCRTLSIEGPIRRIPGRAPHSGVFRTPFDHHGHLIADQFGGPGDADSGNIVPMHGYINNGAGGPWKTMESDIGRLLGTQRGWMHVEARYGDADGIRPHVFRVEVTFSNGMRSRWKIFNYYPHLPNPSDAGRG